MLDVNMPIGVLDSGVGGLSVLKSLVKQLPSENFIYLGDTARTPYGSRKESEVRQFVEQMLCFFDTKNVKLVVIACNTLTVLGVETLKKQHKFDLIGMSKGENLVLAKSKNKKVGVFATEFTIGTGVHKETILKADPTMEVFPLACPDFVPLIEQEQIKSPAMTEAINKYTSIEKKTGIDTLILSCTHYPFIEKELEKALGKDITVIDPADETVHQVENYLAQNKLLHTESKGSIEVFFTADLERGKRLSQYMLEGKHCGFKEIKLG